MSASVGSVTAEPTARSSGTSYAVPVVLAAVAVVVAALQILVVPLLGDLGKALHAEPSAVNWTLIAGQLAGAATMPLLGRRGDLVGPRRVILGVLGVMAAGSLICAVADSLAVLIAGRTLQGVGAGATVVAIALVRRALPEEMHHRSIGIISSGAGVGVGLGFVVGGLLGDWHGAFWISLAACVVMAGLLLAVVPEAPGIARRPAPDVARALDIPGATILAAGLVALLLPISHGNQWGWSSTGVVALFAAAAVLLAAFVAHELRCAQPLADLRLLARAPILLSNVTSLLFGICMGAGFLLWVGFAETPSALGYGFDADALHAGLFLVPNAVAVLVVAPIAGAAAKRVGPGVVLVAGMALGIATFALLSSGHEEKWQLYVGSAAWGTCVTLALVALFLMVNGFVPAREAGAATSITSLGQAVGSAAGSAIFTAILTATFIPRTPVPAASGYTHAFSAAALFATLGLVTAVAALVAARVRRPSLSPVPAAAPQLP